MTSRSGITPAIRSPILQQLDDGHITTKAAAALVGVSDGWARRRRFGRDPALVRARMDAALAEPDNAARYAKRKITFEPVFGQIKHNQGAPPIHPTRTGRGRQ